MTRELLTPRNLGLVLLALVLPGGLLLIGWLALRRVRDGAPKAKGRDPPPS